MNSRMLFELIGTADEQMLEHSEWMASEKRHNFKRKKIWMIAAAATIILAAVSTAMAVKGTNVLRLILDAFSQSDPNDVPDQNVIREQIDKGQWVSLNDENVAVILPESPVKILLSGDGGTTWREAVVRGSDTMEAFGSIRENVQYLGGFIGFFGEKGGYLVLTAGVAMNNQPMRIYLTDDGGETWSEIGNPYNVHASVLTGAGFSTSEIGFISYRYYEDAGPDIWWTADGGDSWRKLTVTIPEKYEECNFIPQSPIFEGRNGVYPIAAHHDGEETTIYMYSDDYGLTWEVQ